MELVLWWKRDRPQVSKPFIFFIDIYIHINWSHSQDAGTSKWFFTKSWDFRKDIFRGVERFINIKVHKYFYRWIRHDPPSTMIRDRKGVGVKGIERRPETMVRHATLTFTTVWISGPMQTLTAAGILQALRRHKQKSEMKKKRDGKKRNNKKLRWFQFIFSIFFFVRRRRGRSSTKHLTPIQSAFKHNYLLW